MKRFKIFYFNCNYISSYTYWLWFFNGVLKVSNVMTYDLKKCAYKLLADLIRFYEVWARFNSNFKTYQSLSKICWPKCYQVSAEISSNRGSRPKHQIFKRTKIINFT